MMKREIIKDERVINSRRKIQSDLCQILLLFLMASILFQQFVLKTPASQYLVEVICIVFSGYYMLYKNITAGNRISPTSQNAKKTAVISSLINGVTITVVLLIVVGTRKDEPWIYDALIIFTFTTLGSLLLTTLLYNLNNKKIKQIEDKLDED